MSAVAPLPQRARLRIRVTGVVQGVGFRPHVHRLARSLELGGHVLNDAHGVLAELEGPEASLEAFLARLREEAPPLSRIEGVRCERLPAVGETRFAIRESARREGGAPAPVSPDAATCPSCLAELLDPGNRRYRYPFINCTDCGPRFTIVRGIPYDRPFTTMAGFTMCPLCRAEYEDPGNRRFHAQPNACPACGPRARLLNASGAEASAAGTDPVAAAARALRDGAILAVKGLGGYHLAARADREETVARLRATKHREEKPFALMAGDLPAAERLVQLDSDSRELLLSVARPIVLAPRRPGAAVAPSVAPRTPELGVMLPYTPLHHLLLADAGTPLVLTSGNASDEPICFRDEEALERLGAIAELFLVHDRPIQTRTDDSVVRVARRPGRGRPAMLRRSRGYVPGSLLLPGGERAPDVLACGAELKNTFCLAGGGRAWVSHHIGDLANAETLRSYTEGIEHFRRLFSVDPQLVAHDLHPEYLSTKYALELEEIPCLGVQHHHAHLAACLAEHGEPGKAVGIVFDGTGYGLDGTVWGGEVLYGDIGSCARVGALRPVPMPGGAQAIRQPWRMACSWLREAGLDTEEVPRSLARTVDRSRWRAVAQLAATGLASPPTSSIGRLFDAVAALAGVRAVVSFEGQAAIELEAACDPAECDGYPVAVRAGEPGLEIDPREMIRRLARDVRAGVPAGVMAARFHAGLARAAVDAGARAAEAAGTELAVLSGGVFANRRLLEAVATGLQGRGLRVLAPELLPCGDGGISYGQAAVAASRAAAR